MSQIDNIRQGLARLASTVETIANTKAAEMPPATVNSISGNAIHGGKITLLRTTGIKDNATRTSLLVDDDLITVGNIDTDNLIGDIDVSGALNVQGKLTVGNLHVEEMTSTQKVTQNIDFHAQGGTLDMMGMQWRKEGEATKQILWRGDRFYISNTVDLHRNAVIEIDNIPVLSADKLGVTIKHSELETVGTLNNLRVSGDITIDDFITYDSGTMRLGVGSEVANAQFSVASNEAEFVVDPDFDHVRVGAYTTSKMSLLTDNKERIVIKEQGGVEVKGALGVKVQYPGDDVDLQVAGAIRFADKRLAVGKEMPTTGNNNQGDIVYDTNPMAGGFMGWVCVESGVPGIWKQFGKIEA
tara:strand:- start:1586 stop:2653 length:1068 start_codon:yes stop_codon:yes gene_type:complete